MSPAEYMLLRAVATRPGMQQCEISEMIGKDKASICRGVANMVKKGYFKTESLSHKCLRVYLSEKGQSIMNDVMSVARDRHRELEKILDKNELRILTEILN